MKGNLLTVIVAVFLLSCGERNYYTLEVENPVYKPNAVFESFEDMSSPKMGQLITKYRLDTIFNGEADEFKRILLLRHWIKSVIPIDDFSDPYPGEGHVERILDHALAGQGYHCGHFMRVQNAVMSAFGFISRTLGAGPGVQEVRFPHHGTNEIWSNQHNKWFMSDAKYDHHFEKDGVPLSALEIRNEYLKNEAADIQKVKGPDRMPLNFDQEMNMSKTEFAQTYTWISWDANNNIFTSWPDYKELLIMFEDTYYKSNTWLRGPNPHWVYSSPEHLKLVQNSDEIYFTPNTISSKVDIKGSYASFKLVSDTPGLKEYQLKKLPTEEWIHIDAGFDMKLKKREYELLFRVVNLAGVPGPEHQISITSRR